MGVPITDTFTFRVSPNTITDLTLWQNNTQRTLTTSVSGDWINCSVSTNAGTAVLKATGYQDLEIELTYGMSDDFVMTLLPKNISTLTHNNITYTIKDAQARTSISNLATVATSGSYNDLTDKPTIPQGTVTSVQIQATSPVQSSTSTAQTTTASTTISLADGYGDTKNPYASKTANYVLAAPNGSNGTPSFRALVKADIPLASETAASGGTTTSLVTTGEKYTWNNKQNALSSQTAYTSKGTATKVPQITTNSLGQVTNVTEVDITYPTEIPTQSGNSGKFLTTNGSTLSWATVQTGGVTSVTAGAGLNTTSDDTSTDGGSITTTGTLYLTKTGVTAGTYQGITVDKYGRITAATDKGYTTNVGTVTSVNDTSPDGNGNVTISIPDAQVQSDWTQTDNTKVDYIKNKPTLATVATSGSYNDLSNKPTIPTVNNATLTIQKNGTTVNTFTANASSDVTANITVPTKVSDLTNDSGYTTNTGTVTSVRVQAGTGLTSSTDTAQTTTLDTTIGIDSGYKLPTTAEWASKQDNLPSQTGQSGKFLTTNGTTMSWAEVASALDDLSDVSISSPTSNQILQYNGTEWENVSLPEWTLNNFTGNTGTTLDTQLTLSSTPMIYRNGVFLTANTDYTISGSTITFTDALVATDIIKVINNLSFSNAPTSSGSIKIINATVVGSLTKDGAVFSGFGTSNYLRPDSRYDKGFLFLDSAANNKLFETVTPTADSWEFGTKIHFVSTTARNQTVFKEDTNYGSIITIGSSGDTTDKIIMALSNTSTSNSIGRVVGTTTLTTDTDYWIKWEFTGSAYNVYLSTDGITYNLEGTVSSQTKITNRGNWFLGVGRDNSSYLTDTSLDLSETYIKVNGEMWWQGVVELTTGSSSGTNLAFTNVVASSWVSDSTYEGYGYKCVLSLAGVTENSFANVIFAPAQADSGDYANICLTGSGTVTIYSKVNDSITIPQIVVMGI